MTYSGSFMRQKAFCNTDLKQKEIMKYLSYNIRKHDN